MNIFDLEQIKRDNSLYFAQDPLELLWLVNMVSRIKPKVVVEIGVESSGCLKYWEIVSEPDALIVGIDMVYRKPCWDVKASPKDIQLVWGDSHDPATQEKLLDVLDGRKIDFLFIDGDHTYEGVKRDWEMYSPLVRDGGAVAFQDVNPNCGPGLFFDTIRRHNKKKVNVRGGSMGIGYVGLVDESYWKTVNYYHKSGYDEFMKIAIPYYSEMNKGNKPVALAEHIRPTRLPAVELPAPEDIPECEPSYISIIVASFNAAHALERVLNAINEQDYPKDRLEVIVVDDASANHYLSYFKMGECTYINTEGSLESPWDIISQMYISDELVASPEPYVYELDRLSKMYPELRITYLRLAKHKTWNRAGAINTASRIARGDILVFLRGDTLVIPEHFCSYVNRHHALNDRLYLHAVTVACRFQIRKDELINWSAIDLPQDHWPEWPGSSIRKENWLKVRGYNEQRVGWGGLENVLGSMADIGMVQAVEPRLVSCGFLGMFRFTLPSEYYQMIDDVMAQSHEAYTWQIPNDENWGMIPVSIRKEYNYR